VDKLPPLLFEAHPQYLRFGGGRLKGQIHTPFPLKDEPLAEVWELSDHRIHSSRIANGPFKGQTLTDLMQNNQAALLGDVPTADDGRFPLMIRLLDIHENLPPAVHPTAEYAAKENLPELGKCEAAYVLYSEPEAKFYATNKPDLKTSQLTEAVRNGRSFDTMEAVKVSTGEVFYVPAGQLHSWGKGVVLYEVHTTSNAIFALDWMEWDKDDERRAYDLRHLEQSIVLDKKPNLAIPAIEYSQDGRNHQVLCANRHFALERIRSDQPIVLNETSNRFALYTLIEGHGEIASAGEKYPMQNYRTALISAYAEESTFIPDGPCVLLKAYVADLKQDIVQPLSEQGVPKEKITALAGNTKQNDLVGFFDDGN
jgi:mannose-6-phosphate isomerase